MNKTLLAIGAGLALLAQATTASAVDVTIRRDAHGTPHVYAKTVHDLFYGYGYAVAQDRLYQMEMTRRSTQGKVAEVLGEKFFEFDRSVRRSYAPERIQDQIDRLPRADKDVLEGYAAGMNAWLREVRARPARWLPKQFKDAGFEPADWTAYDVAMIFVGTIALRFSDPNSEIDNLALVTALTDKHGAATAQQMFDQLKWRVDPKAATTVPSDEGQYDVADLSPRTYALPRYDGVPPVLERIARDAATGDVMGLPPAAGRDLTLAQLAAFGQTGIAGSPTTSNFWLVGKAKARGANTILLNGPQFGWSAPAYTYGIGLHGAGFDVVGNTMYAMPGVMFGHNGRVSWGSTAGVGDGVDIYVERLDPQDRTRYLHEGTWKRMDKRTDTIQVKGAEPVTVDIYRTVHGLVVKFDEKNGVAYAKARAWDGTEVQSLMAWVHQSKARNWSEWTAQAARHALTVNWYYADRDGNIGYVHTGHYPKRRPGHDPRLPVPGTGEMDWLGNLPFASNPKVYNPKQGYIANWNNAPMKGYPSADAFGVLWTRSDRLAELEQRLRERLDRDGGIDAAGMWSLIKPTSLADVNRRHFLPFLERAVASLRCRRRARAAGGDADALGRAEQRRGRRRPLRPCRPRDPRRLAARDARTHLVRRRAGRLLQMVQRVRLSDACMRRWPVR